MCLRQLGHRVLLVIAALGISLTWGLSANAQDINVGTGPLGGIEIDATGVLKVTSHPDPGGTLMRQRIKAAKTTLPRKLSAPSKFRKVSITRLEKEIAAKLARGEQPNDDMLNLAGLTRVEYVFFYPETKDIVIAGPAEGYVSDTTGRMVGTETRRATLQLEDLIVALRAFAPGSKPTGVISVSIDPTPEGLANLQTTLNKVARQMRRAPNAKQLRNLTGTLQNALGLQTVTLGGVSSQTHFAKVLVEADYRMKLIGIGMERMPRKIGVRSYVSLANPSAVSRNALKRWFFVPDYECVRVSDDDLAMQLVGDGVKLIGEDELVSSDGGRSSVGTGDRASQRFVHSFTKSYPKLAAWSPVFAELRNVIDLSVAAAFIQQRDYYGKADWKMPIFGNEKKYPVETYHTPKQVPTACAAVWKGRKLMTPIGGGVQITATNALLSPNLLEDEKGLVDKMRTDVDLSGLAEGQWWWD